MKSKDSYSLQLEAEDAVVTRFLDDLDIALGHDYYQPGRTLFPDFPPEWEAGYPNETPLFIRLSHAYERLDESRKEAARHLVQRALARCARFPLGLRRSLACVDLAHEIDPGLGSERLYSDLMLRPTDADERAELLWQLVRRWRKWNIKVESTLDHWSRAVKEIAPKGIMTLVLYFHAQNASDQRECWQRLRQTALKRIDQEEAALLDVGQDPDLLRKQIGSLLLEGEHEDPAISALACGPSLDDERWRLKDILPDWMQNMTPEDFKDEAERV